MFKRPIIIMPIKNTSSILQASSRHEKCFDSKSCLRLHQYTLLVFPTKIIMSTMNASSFMDSKIITYRISLCEMNIKCDLRCV